MLRRSMTYMLLTITLSMTQLCHGASLSINQTVDVDGSIKLLTTGSAYCFADGTCMTTALVNDGSAIWGQITGLISNQTDLQNQLNLKEDKSKRAAPNGYAPLSSDSTVPYAFLPPLSSHGSINIPYDANYTPVWNKNSTIWLPLNEFTGVFNNTIYNATIDVEWSDSVGFYSDSVNGTYCNIGIFLDSNVSPICSATYSGIYGYLTFDQKFIHCYLSNIDVGSHTITVKHRSDNCAYGSSPKGENSTSRYLNVKFQRNM